MDGGEDRDGEELAEEADGGEDEKGGEHPGISMSEAATCPGARGFAAAARSLPVSALYAATRTRLQVG